MDTRSVALTALTYIKQVDQIVGQTGKVNGGVYQFSVARAEKIINNDMEVPPSMGGAHAINFQPTLVLRNPALKLDRVCRSVNHHPST